MTASRVLWSEHLLFLSSVLTVLRIVVFSDVANSTVSGKIREIQFVRSLVYGLEALNTQEISALTRRWRGLFLVKLTFMLLPVTSWLVSLGARWVCYSY